MGEVTARTRQDMRARDGGCVSRNVLPGPCSGPLEAGHLVGRGAGGTAQGDKYDGVEWLITQCRTHNQDIESNSATRAAAVAAGQRLSRNSPALIPPRALVTYPDGKDYYLNDDGTRERVTDVPWEQNRTEDGPAGDVSPLWTTSGQG